ncbi:MAG: hypothetical protein M3M96_04595, partial [Candidatus Eremiobacteraeota bacterium]|nr:hypothetical protein [Candidatus Eremiobacteraeota bacterium]
IQKYEDELSRQYPNNKHVGPKIRQTLQLLRDQGLIRFDGNGRYSQLKGSPKFSPLIDFANAEGFSSRSQVARLVLETWAELNLYCVNCDSDGLVRLGANTPVADFACASCGERYQLKGKDGRFGAIVPGAAYGVMIKSVREGNCPNYVLIEYNSRFSSVVFGWAIKGAAITEGRVVARNPLATTAKRRGWVGCNVNVAGLPVVRIVQPEVVDPKRARAEWINYPM